MRPNSIRFMPPLKELKKEIVCSDIVYDCITGNFQFNGETLAIALQKLANKAGDNAYARRLEKVIGVEKAAKAELAI